VPDEEEVRGPASSQEPPEVKNLKKLDKALGPIFEAVEAEVAREDPDFPFNEPYTVIHLVMTREGVHRLVEVLHDGRSQKAFKYLLHMGNMILHLIVDQSLHHPGDDDE
jgi:hypothetical protein